MCEVLQVKGVQGSASLLSTQCLCHVPSPLATAFQSLKSPGNERRLSVTPSVLILKACQPLGEKTWACSPGVPTGQQQCTPFYSLCFPRASRGTFNPESPLAGCMRDSRVLADTVWMCRRAGPSPESWELGPSPPSQPGPPPPPPHASDLRWEHSLTPGAPPPHTEPHWV